MKFISDARTLLRSFLSYNLLIGVRMISSRAFGEDAFSPLMPINGKVNYIMNQVTVEDYGRVLFNFLGISQIAFQAWTKIYEELKSAAILKCVPGYSKFMMQNHIRSFMYSHFRCINLPDAIDWREKGAVTAVKNQGCSDCCWIFAAVAAVEGIVMIKKNKLIRLSEQQLLDCITVDYRDKRIVSGRIEWAFDYIMKYGITLEAKYPYTSVKGHCKIYPSVVAINRYEFVLLNNEDELMKAVLKQPVAAYVGINIDFIRYTGGVFECHCSSMIPLHAITIVGYGTTHYGEKFWILKNSWGPEWGEKGFMRMLRGSIYLQGLSGVASCPLFPILD